MLKPLGLAVGAVLALLAIPAGLYTMRQAVDLLVKLLLKAVVKWITDHPDSPFSRFMLRQRGPRTDMGKMSRPQRLASALAFLMWGCLFFGLWMLMAYIAFGLNLVSADNVVVMVLLFALPLLAGCGFLGGLYLLLRVFV